MDIYKKGYTGETPPKRYPPGYYVHKGHRINSIWAIPGSVDMIDDLMMFAGDPPTPLYPTPLHSTPPHSTPLHSTLL